MSCLQLKDEGSNTCMELVPKSIKRKILIDFSLQLKGIVTRHQLPLNNALIDKTIERLDPFSSGSVRFVDLCLYIYS